MTGPRLRAAAAKREITPPPGADLSGFIARLTPSTGAAEPMHVRALVVASGDRRLAIVQADLLGFAAWHVAEVRDFAAVRLGLRREDVLLSATHTHSGPGVVLVRGCRMAPASYQRSVVRAAQDSLKEASESLADATLETGSVRYELGVNRRQETPTGVILGVAPDKPRPDRLRVARFRTDARRILLFSHACHPYVLGGDSVLASGDFPSLACAELEQDRRTIALFLNGCAGNIAPLSAFQGIDKARAEGARLAAAVESSASALERTAPQIIDGDIRLAHLPHQPIPTEDEIHRLARLEERVVRPEEKMQAAIPRKLEAAMRDWSSTMTRVVRRERPLDPVHCELQALRIGPLTLLGIAGEPFFEIGEALARGRLGGEVWPLGYTNAYCGYIPTGAEYPAGGYEVDDAWKYVGLWKIDPASDEVILEAGRRLLDSVAACK